MSELLARPFADNRQTVTDGPETPAAVATLVAPDQRQLPPVTPRQPEAPAATPAHRRRAGRWALAGLLAAQAFGSLRLRNSVFQDEALYLWAGHQETAHFLHGAPLFGNFASYFSGTPGLYPVIASVIDTVYGLAGARLFSLIWMLIASLCVFGVSRRLFAASVAAPAVVAFALSGPVLFMGHLATFDAMCVGLLALAAYAAVRAAGARRPGWALLVGPLVVAAVLSKYAGALFVPTIFGILLLESRRRRGWLVAVVNVVVAAAAAGLVTVVVLHQFGTSVLAGLRATTTNRTVLLRAQPWPLLHKSLALGGFFALFALVGCLALPRRQRLLGTLLFGTVLLAPAYHVYKGEPVSLPKHIGFGMFFAAPLVGRALSRCAGRRFSHLSGRRFAAAVAVGLLLVATGFTQSSSLFHEWSNSDSLVVTLKSMVRPGSGHILAEEAEVPRYRLRGLVDPWQWSDLNWFEYTDQAGVHRAGLDAYQAAIKDRYFDVIVLRYGANAGTAMAVHHDIETSGGYDLVATLPFSTSFGTGAYSVWRVTSAAHATSGTGVQG